MNPQNVASMSALMAAAARAAHAIVDDEPHLLDDTVGRALCRGVPSPSPLDYQVGQPHVPLLAAARLSAVTRSAFAEARLAHSGIAQYVVLGAGLDTSAHRLTDAGTVRRAWLLDRDGVLAWRAQVFAHAGLADVGTFVSCDLSEQSAVDELVRHGLDTAQPVFVAWLGVSMYLDAAAVASQFVDLARLATGSRLVFDYVLPPGRRDEAGVAYADAVSTATGSAGEPWAYTPDAETLSATLSNAGWETVEDVAEAEATGTGFWPRADALRPMRLIRLRHAVLGTNGSNELGDATGRAS